MSTAVLEGKREPKLLDRVREAARVRHLSLRTEKSYVNWIRRYILFHAKKHPKEMGEAEINAFLTHLAVEHRVSASTQTQALCALLFLYRTVLGQKLTLHPHLHCIVPGGGLSIDGDWWVGSRPDFFLPVPVLKKLFRGKVLAAIKTAAESGALPSSHLPALGALYRKSWVVYCKPPFGSPEQVLAYLARYTHRVAISNQRLVRLAGEEVTFTWKDYAQGQRLREMTLSGEEFLRRFLLHVLPERFVRIRYYGLLANRHRETALALCRKVLPGPPTPPKLTRSDWQSLLQSLTGVDPMRCEICGQNALHLVGELVPAPPPRAPPR